MLFVDYFCLVSLVEVSALKTASFLTESILRERFLSAFFSLPRLIDFFFIIDDETFSSMLMLLIVYFQFYSFNALLWRMGSANFELLALENFLLLLDFWKYY